MHRFVAIHYSPWSEKARWALDARRVPYREETFVPMLSEPSLRLKLRRFTGKITVPVLFAEDGRAFTDSYEIARFADEIGDAPRLFPAGREAEIRRWNELSEKILAAGRALSVAKAMESEKAREESVPRALPKALRPLIGRLGVRYLQRKYGISIDREASASIVREGLLELRKALGGKRFLGEAFSYADIVMATSMQLVAPVADDFIRIGRGTRAVCTHEPIIDELSDVIAWRDKLYRELRKR